MAHVRAVGRLAFSPTEAYSRIPGSPGSNEGVHWSCGGSILCNTGSVWRVDAHAQPKQWRLTVGADTGAMETHPGTVEAHPTLEAMKTLLVTDEARTGVVVTHQWTMDPHPGASGVAHL
jgi:hypothetical protein